MQVSIPSLDPARRLDHLAGAVQQSLPRPMSPKLTWGAVKTTLLGGLSGGVIPLLLLPRRFREFARSEREQLWHLAEWIRLQSPLDAEHHRLCVEAASAAKRVGPSSVLRFVSLACAAIAVGIAFSTMRMTHAGLDTWFATITPGLKEHNFRFHPVGAESVRAFALAMSAAGICWLGAVNVHILRVRGFVHRFNQLAALDRVVPVYAPLPHLGLRPRWLIGALLLAMGAGALWGVPILLAAGAQASYINRTSRRLRESLARRQRDVLLRQRPAIPVPASVYLLTSCPQPNCRAALPPEARYCRRCGTRLSAADA